MHFAAFVQAYLAFTSNRPDQRGQHSWVLPLAPSHRLFPEQRVQFVARRMHETCSHGRQKEQNEEEFQTSFELARTPIVRAGVLPGASDQCPKPSAKRYPFPPASCGV